MYYRKYRTLYNECFKNFCFHVTLQQVKDIKTSYQDVTWPQVFQNSFDIVFFITIKSHSLSITTQTPKEILCFCLHICFSNVEKSVQCSVYQVIHFNKSKKKNQERNLNIGFLNIIVGCCVDKLMLVRLSGNSANIV